MSGLTTAGEGGVAAEKYTVGSSLSAACLSPAHSPLQVPHRRQRRVSHGPDTRFQGGAGCDGLPSFPSEWRFHVSPEGYSHPPRPLMSRAHKVAEQGLK